MNVLIYADYPSRSPQAIENSLQMPAGACCSIYICSTLPYIEKIHSLIQHDWQVLRLFDFVHCVRLVLSKSALQAIGLDASSYTL